MRTRTIKTGIAAFLILSAAGIFWMNRENYYLNRTVREITLRLIQVSIRSRTTEVEYRVHFHENGYLIEVKDTDSENWEMESGYDLRTGIRSHPGGLRCYFVRGRFVGYDINGKRGPRYVLLHFKHNDNPLKRSLIFFRRGEWRPVGYTDGE
ncbi:MAG: hypothetical protein R6V02_02965 [Candidatus Aminicenantes bacterium]